MRVTVYSKPGCHLCEEVLLILDRLAIEYALEVREVNILEDMALYEAYSTRIPVVEVEDGRLGRLEAPIDEAKLRMHFEIARRAGSRPSSVVAPKHKREPVLDRMAAYIGRHWLRLAVIAMLIFTGLPWLAPVFAALGWWDLANPIYTAYAFT